MITVTDEMIKRAAEEFAAATYCSWSEPVIRREFQRAMKRALTVALAGRAVVPREPTRKQIDAIELTLAQDVLSDYGYPLPEKAAGLLYRAMINACVDGGVA